MRSHHRSTHPCLTLALLTLAVACTEAAAPDPVLLEMVQGDAQEAPAGAQVAEPLIVRITDLDGEPLPDVAVEWTVLEGAGTVQPQSAVTDAEGLAEARWTVGAEQGTQRVEARARGEGVVFEALATPEHPADWAEVVEASVVAVVDGDRIRVELTLTSQWPGTLRMETPSSCLAYPKLYDAQGALASGFSFGCWAAVWRHTLGAGESLVRVWDTPVAPHGPGTYTARVEINVVRINGVSATVPDASAQVTLGS